MQSSHDMRTSEPQPKPPVEATEVQRPDEDRHVPKKKSGMPLKRKLKLAALAIVLALIAYGVWWINSTASLRAEAIALQEDSEAYQSLLNGIDQERSRCQGLITQGEGDFGSFEYCKQFIRWAEPYQTSETP
ncbi:hypothetical protein N9L26_01645 [Candidatus Pacebacteria bacterium]|nr:hypothetical protein [Candidatus Paceibacterota bacterium]